ncbi:hypothetical protein LXL04_016843 [Taraxacum kok-saghyz]
MAKLNRPQPPFTAPEMEVALQLIQLGVDLHPNEVTDSTCNISTTTNTKRKTRQQIVDDDDESHGSCTSDVSFFITPWFMDLDDNDVAGIRRKRKKFRSVVEIYEISKRLKVSKSFCYG